MIKYNQKIKNQARSLRKKGYSYREIQKIVPVAKSTLSVWLKGVALSEEQKERLYTKQIMILSRGPQSQKERRKKEIKEIEKNASREIQVPLTFEAFRLFGAALYWAEGDKGRAFKITNSDPNLILFMVKWLEGVFSVSPKKIKANLNIYSQQNDANLKKFWARLTDIPLENFGKSFIKPSGKGYKKNNLYYGTIKLYVVCGSDFVHKIRGWIMAATNDSALHAQTTFQKWGALKSISRPINLMT